MELIAEAASCAVVLTAGEALALAPLELMLVESAASGTTLSDVARATALDVEHVRATFERVAARKLVARRGRTIRTTPAGDRVLSTRAWIEQHAGEPLRIFWIRELDVWWPATDARTLDACGRIDVPAIRRRELHDRLEAAVVEPGSIRFGFEEYGGYRVQLRVDASLIQRSAIPPLPMPEWPGRGRASAKSPRSSRRKQSRLK